MKNFILLLFTCLCMFAMASLVDNSTPKEPQTMEQSFVYDVQPGIVMIPSDGLVNCLDWPPLKNEVAKSSKHIKPTIKPPEKSSHYRIWYGLVNC